ncbi:MAG: hypothetical protein ACMXYF_03205 [Candidatus Woesearchaeota archaeon]
MKFIHKVAIWVCKLLIIATVFHLIFTTGFVVEPEQLTLTLKENMYLYASPQAQGAFEQQIDEQCLQAQSIDTVVEQCQNQEQIVAQCSTNPNPSCANLDQFLEQCAQIDQVVEQAQYINAFCSQLEENQTTYVAYFEYVTMHQAQDLLDDFFDTQASPSLLAIILQIFFIILLLVSLYFIASKSEFLRIFAKGSVSFGAITILVYSLTYFFLQSTYADTSAFLLQTIGQSVQIPPIAYLTLMSVGIQEVFIIPFLLFAVACFIFGLQLYWFARKKNTSTSLA